MSKVYIELFERLSALGWRFNIIPRFNHSKNPDVWAVLQGKIKVVYQGEEKSYTARRSLSIKFEFNDQFEDFIEHVDNAHHSFVIPHMSGRITNGNSTK